MTTEALMNAFDARGCEQHVSGLGNIAYADGGVRTRTIPYSAEALRRNPVKQWVEVGAASRYEWIRDLDLIFIRVDPPVTEQFRHGLIMLAAAEEESDRTLFINSPREICFKGSKILTARLHDFAPPSLVSGDCDQIRDFMLHAKSSSARWVVKPLDELSGRGVYAGVASDPEFLTRIEKLLGRYAYLMVQPYLSQIEQLGETRCLVFMHRLLVAWIKRPAPGNFKSNRDEGATVEPVKIEQTPAPVAALTERVRSILPGTLFYSADFIGEHLVEVNHENVGGICDACQLYSCDYADTIAAELIRLGNWKVSRCGDSNLRTSV